MSFVFLLLQIVEENYLCTNDCKMLERSIRQVKVNLKISKQSHSKSHFDPFCFQDQLSNRLVKLRLRVLRANIAKLLCVCVPEREKWLEFGWIGKAVDDILEELSKYHKV